MWFGLKGRGKGRSWHLFIVLVPLGGNNSRQARSSPPFLFPPSPSASPLTIRGHARTGHLDQSPGGLETGKQNENAPRVCQEQLPLVATVIVRGDTCEGSRRPTGFVEGRVAPSREREEIF